MVPRLRFISRFVRWAGRGIWEKLVPGACREWTSDGHADDRLHAHQSTPLGHGPKGGNQQAVGRSRGGAQYEDSCTLPDAKGRLIARLLTGGEAHDCPVADRLIRQSQTIKTPARRQGLRQRRVALRTGSKAWQAKAGDSEQKQQETTVQLQQPGLYKLRWRIESAFNRLKDFRRIATRYDKLAPQLPTSSICLATALVYGGFNEF